MAELTRAMDWSSTLVGPITGWSQSLKAAVGICLGSRHPMVVWWGNPAYTQFYNDAYIPFLGEGKHPRFLGRSGRECWSEIWPIIGPMLDGVFTGGQATWSEDLLLVLNRNLPQEETYFTFSYSPIRNDDGIIGGIFCACNETTSRVVGERRLRTLRDLSRMEVEQRTVEKTCEVAARTLSENPGDIPFALIYLWDGDANSARLVAKAGLQGESAAAPDLIDLKQAAEMRPTWPLRRAFEAGTAQLVSDASAKFGPLPGGLWPESSDAALVVPIASPGQIGPTGYLVCGLSPRRVIDADYRGFLDVVAGQIGSRVASARSYEEERRRAEALAEIDRAKTVFFSNISHEFRTPLTLLMGPLEDTLSQSDDLRAADRERLRLAQRNSLRLLKLVNTLLDFSRIEAGRIEASYAPTDLAALTAELASVFRATIERVGMRLSIDCPPLAEPVYVDREMWEKIVLNLVSNAFKFTFAGAIDVSLRQVNALVEMTISDSGTGIPADEIPHLFERFHRVKNARGRSYEGSGIGLALVQELVKLHGGTVRVESEVGRGSRFIVAVPLGTSHLPADRIAAERTLASTGLRADAFVEEISQWSSEGSRKEKSADAYSALASHEPPLTAVTQPERSTPARILLADDNADMRGYVERLLMQSGYQVIVVADGMAALHAARAHKPDLVLTDVMMPGLDGFGLARELRAHSELASIPIILLSARAGEEARIEGMQAGADDYLTKPFGARELVARIQASLRLAQVRQEADSVVRKSEERLRALVSATSYVLYRMNPDWTAMLELEGQGFIADTQGPNTSWLNNYIHPDDRAQVAAAIQKAIDTKSMFELEHRVRRLDGTLGWTLLRAVPILDAAGEIVEWFGAASDITQRVQAENTRQLLLGELNHRVRNTLASVQAIAQQTLRNTQEPADFASRFSGRIQSLSRVHSLLTNTTWQGADLRELIGDQLLQGPVDETKLTASGPAVHLEPQTAVHLALMLHELGTNSTKYGALSANKGKVSVGWSVTDDVLHLQWSERGGPTVKAPTRRGFGTTLIEQSVKSGGGSAQMLCEPEGITWKLSMQLLHRAPGKEFSGSLDSEATNARMRRDDAGDTTKPQAVLAGLRALIVEDEPLIALDLVSSLQIAGAQVEPPVGTEEGALQIIESGDFDVALLDANLHGCSVNDVAAALTRRNIPFVFITGYGRESLPSSFKDVPALAKPISDQQLLEAIIKLTPTNTNVGLAQRRLHGEAQANP